MESVRAFNSELSSLYENRPPVSRAKMAQVTKCAIKAIKFYKHVVQSVEKFIQKCKPEYKVPGLYVIDSIVRQSRHQFGPEKDVFSPRFTKNIVTTFTHLFKCPPDERSRVVRVLNLWQKNNVFPVEVIQPLLDLAADPGNQDLVTAAQHAVDAVVSITQKVPLPGTHSSSNGGDSTSNQILQQTEMLTTITKLLQQAQEGAIMSSAPESQIQELQHLQQQLVMQTERIMKPQHQSALPIDSNLLAQIQVLTNQLLSKTVGGEVDLAGDASKLNSGEPLFNRKLLDFDYGDSDEDDERQDHHHHHHHHQHRPPGGMQHGMPPAMQDPSVQQQIQQMSQQQEQLQSEIGAQEQLRRRVFEQQQQHQFDRELGHASMMGHHPPHGFGQPMDRREEVIDDDGDDRDVEEVNERNDRRSRHRGSRDRSPRRRSRRSRSRSRDRRRRSRSRERHRRSRSRDRERLEREKERERRKRGLPPLQDHSLSICTTTLWFGHLTKHTTEDELRKHIEKHGTIRTINMIPPRGCAFVCLTKRKDAFNALERLKGVKVNGNSLKVAWAPGIGVKESIFKNLWDPELGVTYIPWEQLPTDVAPFIAGGMVDEDSIPERLKGMNTGEEDIEEVPPPQPEQDDTVDEDELMAEEMMMSSQQQALPPMQMTLPQAALAGQALLNLLGASLLRAPPPLGMQPNLGATLGMGGPGNIRGLNNIGLPNSLGGLPGLAGPRPNMPGMGPGPLNIAPRIPIIGGQGNLMGGPSPGIDIMSSPRINSPGPRHPFGQFGNLPRFPHQQSPGGMRPPFFNSDSNDSDQAGIGDADRRALAEPKEWPPDDDVNPEDEPDEDLSIDSEERSLLTEHQRMARLGIPNLGPLGGPFGPRGPMLNVQGHPNPMLGMPRPPSPNPGLPSLLSVHMMPPGQQPPPVLAVPEGPGPGFALTPGGVKLPLSAVGMRPGLMPPSASPRLLSPSPGAHHLPVAVNVNGSMLVTKPGLPPSNIGGRDSPDEILDAPDMPSLEEDLMRHRPGPLAFMQIPGGNPPPGAPFLGRGFAPMTIRPRGGPGLMGLRPGIQGGGFNRFRGPPRPLMGPLFGGMDRPMFGNRFGLPFRPPMGFMEQNEWELRDDRRLPPRFDLEDHLRAREMMERGHLSEFDEIRASPGRDGRGQLNNEFEVRRSPEMERRNQLNDFDEVRESPEREESSQLNDFDEIRESPEERRNQINNDFNEIRDNPDKEEDSSQLNNDFGEIRENPERDLGPAEEMEVQQSEQSEQGGPPCHESKWPAESEEEPATDDNHHASPENSLVKNEAISSQSSSSPPPSSSQADTHPTPAEVQLATDVSISDTPEVSDIIPSADQNNDDIGNANDGEDRSIDAASANKEATS